MENAFGLVIVTKSTKTSTIAVHAVQKRAVIEITPRQDSIKVVSQGQLADAQTDFIMPDGILGTVVKGKIAQK